MANRRVQGGGDPAQGPLRDEIRTVPDSGTAASFPDVPPGNRPDGSNSQHDPHRVDPDAFAERLGLRDDGRDAADRENAGPGHRPADVVRRGIGIVLATAGLTAHGVASGLSIASRSLDRVGDRLDRR